MKKMGVGRILWKTCWIPHILTDEQKEERVEVAEYMLEKYGNADPRRMKEIVTGDETRMYEAQSIEDNTVWLPNGAKAHTVAGRCITRSRLYISFYYIL